MHKKEKRDFEGNLAKSAYRTTKLWHCPDWLEERANPYTGFLKRLMCYHISPLKIPVTQLIFSKI